MRSPVLAALLFAAAGTTACTGTPDLDATGQPIIGGRTVPSSDFPTVVALENRPGDWFCTGTLIHEKWVLTAAHCVEGETAASLKIRFDDTNVNDGGGGRQVAVAAIHGHPGYDGIAWDNDIAVVELAEAVTDRPASKVHRASPAAGTMMTQVGYGDADDNGGGAGLLRAVDNTSIDCARANDPEVSGANMLCFDGSSGRSTCYGDSGGPTFIRVGSALEVAGVTSGGTVDSCTAGYDLETLVIAEIDFVDQYVPHAGPTDPDPTDPDPTDPDPTDPDPDERDDEGGCSTGGGGGGVGGALVLGAMGLVGAVRRRRRR